MKTVWITSLLLIQSYHTIYSQLHADEYNQYSFYQKRPLSPRPLDAMADLTNDLGVSVLGVIAAGGAIGNIAFSPFGLMAVSVLLYEGSSGYSALQIKQSLNLPWEILAVRIGVRDLNRYLKTYFKSDGFLNGLTMSREEVCLRPQFKQVLRLYGFDDPNNFLIDSCSQSAATTVKPMSITTHGTVVTEMTPTSQIMQVLTNITNASTSDLSIASTSRPAKITYLGDSTFTYSNLKMNNNVPMNSQTDMMIVDIETQPNLRPIELSTDQVATTVLINKQKFKSSSEVGITDKKPNESIATTNVVTESISVVSDDPMMGAATATKMSSSHDSVTNSQFEKLMGTQNNYEKPHIDLVEISTKRLHESTTTDDTLHASIIESKLGVNQETVLPSNSFVSSMENKPDVTPAFTSNTQDTTIDYQLSSIIDVKMDSKIDDMINEKHALVKNVAEMMPSTAPNELTTDNYKTTNNNIVDFNEETTADTIPFIPTLKSDNSDRSSTAIGITRTVPVKVINLTTSPKLEFNNNDDATTTSDENMMSTTELLSTILNLSNATENEIIKEAESNQHYQIASFENKSARSLETSDNLPTFNVEFVVKKEHIPTDCNHTRKRTIIKPDKILTEYPKNSGVSITLEKSKRRKRRHLEQYQRYNGNRNNWFNGYKSYVSQPGWMDRSSGQFDPARLFNSGYRNIPYFTYTAVLPFGFIFELKSEVIEIPLDDPKYTLMILMPNSKDGLTELLVLLPTIPLRFIHNSLKPTAVHATIPAFKYTAKVDLTSALQQIGIQDVFYRYRADLSFMSPDARLFVSSVQQVVSVTAKKYNTPPVYEIQRKYVERDFIVSKPFVYFVIDIHTKVSLIAGVITDPLASPIWV